MPVACHIVQPTIVKRTNHQKHQCQRSIRMILIIMCRLDSVSIRRIAVVSYGQQKTWARSIETYRCRTAWRCASIFWLIYSKSREKKMGRKRKTFQNSRVVVVCACVFSLHLVRFDVRLTQFTKLWHFYIQSYEHRSECISIWTLTTETMWGFMLMEILPSINFILVLVLLRGVYTCSVRRVGLHRDYNNKAHGCGVDWIKNTWKGSTGSNFTIRFSYSPDQLDRFFLKFFFWFCFVCLFSIAFECKPIGKKLMKNDVFRLEFVLGSGGGKYHYRMIWQNMLERKETSF